MYRSIKKHTNTKAKIIQIVGGDFNAELGLGCGVERVSVGPHTLKEGKSEEIEAMADDAKLHSAQHDVRKNA